MTAPTVVLHRPPLPRIDFTRPPRAPEPIELEHIKAARELGERIKQQRLWELIRQSAEGCNPGRAGQ